MKIKSNKKLISILLGVSFISLASIGFASWVINNPTNTGDNATISVQIGEIDDASLTAKIIDDKDLANPIRFDSLDADSCADAGFITNGEETTENLDVKFTYTITGETALNKGDCKVSYVFSGDAGALKTAIGGTTQYIDTTCLTDCKFTLPNANGPMSEVEVAGSISADDLNITNNVTYNDQEFKVTTIETTIAFKWGSAFAGNKPEGKNPCLITSDDGFDAEGIISTLKAFETAYEPFKTDNPEIILTITPSRS